MIYCDQPIVEPPESVKQSGLLFTARLLRESDVFEQTNPKLSITAFSSQEIWLQLTFDEPGSISTGLYSDKLEISILGDSLFSEVNLLPVDTSSSRRELPKQFTD